MNEKNESRLYPGLFYNLKDVCRIVNPKQQTLYIKNGLLPIDLYASINQDGANIIVMIFDRETSYPLYQKWCDHELN